MSHPKDSTMHIAVIGAGAAGCLAAIETARRLPHAHIRLYEGGHRPLAKVAVTGGGRCNLTNSFAQVKILDRVYPRGAKLMKRLLREFSHRDTCQWFEREGVRLLTQDDECVFPVSQDAMEIVHTLLRLLHRHGVEILTRHRLTRLERQGRGYRMSFAQGDGVAIPDAEADTVVVTTGGSPRPAGLEMLAPLGLELIAPAPSLFSLCLPGHPLTALPGTVVKHATASIPGTKMSASGPLLLTHWGMSGPAILKLSAYAARYLQERGYKSKIATNWFGERKENAVADLLDTLARQHPQKQLQSVYPEVFNARLWRYLLTYCKLRPDSRWGDLQPATFGRMAAMLTNHVLEADGKNRFKEEFVTSGGVALSNVSPATLECHAHPGLYFAGEVLDVDAITGGFNLQAAWTMGYVVARSIARAAEPQ